MLEHPRGVANLREQVDVGKRNHLPQECLCQDCGRVWTRTSGAGPRPKRCPDCTAAHNQASRKTPARLVTCQGCGEQWWRTSSGRPPKLCDSCIAGRRLRQCPTCGARGSYLGKQGHGPMYCSDPCKPRCAVSGCPTPYKYRTGIGLLCPPHYVRWKTTGDPGSAALLKDFSPPPDTCRQCGGPRGAGYAKWYCSVRCFGRYYDGVDEGRVWSCIGCGAEMTPADYRSDAVRCGSCGRSAIEVSVAEVAVRSGTDCGICGEPVDMLLPRTDLYGPVRDHIVPAALGGGDGVENLQIAHFRCNAVKQHRELTAARVAELAADARRSVERAPELVFGMCGAGHPRNAESGYWARNGWACRSCRNARQRERRAAETPDQRVARYVRENTLRRARWRNAQTYR